MKHAFPLLTYVEAGEAAGAGRIPILPVGTIECNGPQLPMGYDYLVSEALARRVAEETGNLWLPPITYGVSEVLAGFPGTIFVRAELLSQQVEAILASLVRSGFDHILILNNHVPNQQPVEDACRRVRKATGVLVASIYPALLAKALTKDLYEGETGTIGHGADPGTSLMLHLNGDAVRMDLAEKNSIKNFDGFEIISPFAVKHEGSEVNLYTDLEELSETGSWGDPHQASAEKGAEIFERMVRFITSFVERFEEFDTRSRNGTPRATGTPVGVA